MLEINQNTKYIKFIIITKTFLNLNLGFNAAFMKLEELEKLDCAMLLIDLLGPSSTIYWQNKIPEQLAEHEIFNYIKTPREIYAIYNSL